MTQAEWDRILKRNTTYAWMERFPLDSRQAIIDATRSNTQIASLERLAVINNKAIQ